MDLNLTNCVDNKALSWITENNKKKQETRKIVENREAKMSLIIGYHNKIIGEVDHIYH